MALFDPVEVYFTQKQQNKYPQILFQPTYGQNITNPP